MPEQTICCTCGNILRLRDATPGAAVKCSRCKKPWVVPQPPKPASKPALRRVAAAAEAPAAAQGGLSPAFVAIAVGSTVLVILVAVLLIVALRGGESPGGPAVASASPQPTAAPSPSPEPVKHVLPASGRTPEVEIPPGEPDNGKAATKPEDAPKLTGSDYQSQLDLWIYRLNTGGLVARILELRGMDVGARKLRDSMREFERNLQDVVGKSRLDGHNPFVPEHCLPDDAVFHLDRHDLSKLTAGAADRLLTDFVAAIRPGTRARLVVKRGSEWQEFDVQYHTRPKELYAILQLASIVPGSSTAGPTGDTPAPVKPKGSEGPGPLAILVNASRRAAPLDRSSASQALAERASLSRAPCLLSVAAHYLAYDDTAWRLSGPNAAALQAYFDGCRIVEAESFDGARHLAALNDLAKRMGELAPKDCVLPMFAAAHAGDALLLGAGAADVAKAAKAANLSRTADGKMWGDDASVLKLDLGREAAGAKISGALARFDGFRSHADFGVGYLGAYLVVIETIDRNQGGYDKAAIALKAAAKGAPETAAAHLQALVESLEAFARCTKCQNGRIKCPKCGGDGKADVKCPDCEGKGQIEWGEGDSRARKMCSKCSGKGVFKNVECGCGKTGNKVDCPECKAKVWKAQVAEASRDKVLTLSECGRCGGRGSLLERVALACPDCQGLGRLVVPAKDPSKLLK